MKKLFYSSLLIVGLLVSACNDTDPVEPDQLEIEAELTEGGNDGGSGGEVVPQPK